MSEQSNMTEYMDHVPSCAYNNGVGCPYKNRKCFKCGFNPEVSYKRIKAKYGVKGTLSLSLPEKMR